eukprot:CAMPEP_0184697168 /NCGR_PEP_ID=MMETSP0313-20130426/4215_1 /TAXON_ID=2792 /ORGANISM="Porphyridium aerugineum, Strain SAG 1380-2" /LENGTH=354 /DNA_ID=CAMNT_0027155931 /DNA_START=259 /DNA_END=1323 /DNA_ORIENTATION=+
MTAPTSAPNTSAANGNPNPARPGTSAALPIWSAPALERDLPERCTECRSDDIVENWKEGNLVCRDCGVVVQTDLVDLGSEWRTFTNDEPGTDPNRVGGPANPLLESGPTTKIQDDGKDGMALNKAQKRNAISASDRYLIDVFARVNRIAEHFSVSQHVRDRTEEIFKRYYDHLTLKEDGTRSRQLKEDETSEIIAACLLIAFRNGGVPRGYKEVCALTHVPKKNIGARVKLIERAIEGVKQGEPQGVADYLARYCSRLGLPREVLNWTIYVFEHAKEKEGVYGRQPNSIMAACLFIVCRLGKKENRRTGEEIGAIAGVADVTVRVTYRMILPYLSSILPPDFMPDVPIESLSPA